jgi:hypothetical protein
LFCTRKSVSMTSVENYLDQLKANFWKSFERKNCEKKRIWKIPADTCR